MKESWQEEPKENNFLTKATKTKIKHRNSSEESSEEEEFIDDINICCENHLKIKQRADRIQWAKCRKWLHETCTMYGLFCNSGGRDNKGKGNEKRSRKNEEACCDTSPLPHLRERLQKCNDFYCVLVNHISFSFKLCRVVFVPEVKELLFNQ